MSWETFQRMSEELSNSPNKRLAYYEGYLEIMSPLGEHENNNWFIARLIFTMAEEWDLNIKSFGSLTLKRNDIQKGIEPDACFFEQTSRIEIKFTRRIDYSPFVQTDETLVGCRVWGF